MKSLLLTTSLTFALSAGFAQNVAINNDGTLAHASAALDIKSSSKGLLVPRLTTAERSAVPAPAKGLLVFDTDTNSFWFFNGSAWTNLSTGGDNNFALPYAGTAASGTPAFAVTNNGLGSAIYGRNDKGTAAEFVNNAASNKYLNLLNVLSYGDGNTSDFRLGNAASFEVRNVGSVAAAVRARINTDKTDFGAAAIFAESVGTGGYTGLFHATNPNGNGAGLMSLNDGKGNAIYASANGGNGVETKVDGAGHALYSWVSTFGTGQAGKFQNYNVSNTSNVVSATTVGTGIAGYFKVDNQSAAAPAVRAEINSASNNFGTAGVYGRASGVGGFGGVFHAANVNGGGTAVVALAEGNGNAITAQAKKIGNGLEVSAYGTGHAIFAWLPTTGQGQVARFSNFNGANNNTTILVESGSTAANLVEFRSGHPYMNNVARINGAGKGFFNGGTQNSGADLAEAFDVSGDLNSYAPGDVLVISKSKDRAVERSSKPYSNLVAGVYATKPGVLLTEEHIDNDLKDKVPMGVVGVIPTKVCLEGGAIERGDMLVTSSQPGVAMKADPDKVKLGQVIGKALQDYNGTTTGKINVLVNVK